MLNTSKHMEWEKCTIDLKIALITNSFGHNLSNDKRKVHAKNYVSKYKNIRLTVKRLTRNWRPSILAKTLYISYNRTLNMYLNLNAVYMKVTI